MDVLHVSIHSSVDEYMGRSHLMAILNNAAMSIGIRFFLRMPVFHYFGYLPRSGTAGSHGSTVFNFLRKHQTSNSFLHLQGVMPFQGGLISRQRRLDSCSQTQAGLKEVSLSKTLSQACSNTGYRQGFEQLSLLLCKSRHELAGQEYLPASEASLLPPLCVHTFGKEKEKKKKK